MYTRVSYTAAKYIEGVALYGRARTATGNSADNRLEGNHYSNTLDGLAGADTMQGNGGNDVYHVDDKGDRVIELYADYGTDTVFSSVSFTLSKFVEKLTLTGSASTSGKGNASDNVLRGNAGANKLDGAAGADTLVGGDGNDTYHVDNAGDLVLESGSALGGVDTVLSSVSLALGRDVENLTLTALTALDATGNSSGNVLTGNSRSNVLAGAAAPTRPARTATTRCRAAPTPTAGRRPGKDELSGGSGADRFTYTAASESTRAAFDVITDFTRGADRIDLSRLDANTSTPGVDNWRFIGSAGFGTDATGQLRYAYDSGTGALMLYGSTDADRTAEFAVAVSGHTSLAASDFLF
ncbi:calcium-binding protein [Ramlibacter terrae]|uniref:Calcium-binding protein n=1 Tax=Ramlibacter terrae TaxID=2732511 RepID=A0ABX6P2W9_9BURK|nr:calcium-binding protein [Ramlibacter terrae]